ncbi:MAG: L-threonylcarbamoyladenylate synthase [Syntrophorhabdaceae bacterium]|jgi:tRNA threonylcarbamoyl adenosine modification protein (Sua5/YciO/YrdC/YwlC family)|nr:L-threonylcarbamoyladenylate synthase [Syntrophorhabdaceae bacterium]
MIVEWDPARPRKKITGMIKEVLSGGGIIAYPTDTVYGMGCDLFNIKAIRKLYLSKRLDNKRGLSVICRDFKDISNYAVMSDPAFELLKVCLPGPYTFVLKARKIMPKLLMTDKKEVGIRIPDHPVPIALAELIERPIINTSVRISGEEVLTDPRQIEKNFKDTVDIVIDGGIVMSRPSTVIRLLDDAIEVLREGKGSLKNILR